MNEINDILDAPDNLSTKQELSFGTAIVGSLIAYFSAAIIVALLIVIGSPIFAIITSFDFVNPDMLPFVTVPLCGTVFFLSIAYMHRHYEMRYQYPFSRVLVAHLAMPTFFVTMCALVISFVAPSTGIFEQTSYYTSAFGFAVLLLFPLIPSTFFMPYFAKRTERRFLVLSAFLACLSYIAALLLLIVLMNYLV